MTDKSENQKTQGGCCGGAAKTMTINSSCSTEKTAATKNSQGEQKTKTGSCGC
jgi:hypothetical protein